MVLWGLWWIWHGEDLLSIPLAGFHPSWCGISRGWILSSLEIFKTFVPCFGTLPPTPRPPKKEPDQKLINNSPPPPIWKSTIHISTKLPQENHHNFPCIAIHLETAASKLMKKTMMMRMVRTVMVMMVMVMMVMMAMTMTMLQSVGRT